MTLDEFYQGHPDDRAAWVWQQGTLLAERPWEQYRVCLYHLGEFFAELYYRKKNNQLYLVRGFQDRRLLEPYLDTIDISALV